MLTTAAQRLGATGEKRPRATLANETSPTLLSFAAAEPSRGDRCSVATLLQGDTETSEHRLDAVGCSATDVDVSGVNAVVDAGRRSGELAVSSTQYLRTVSSMLFTMLSSAEINQ